MRAAFAGVEEEIEIADDFQGVEGVGRKSGAFALHRGEGDGGVDAAAGVVALENVRQKVGSTRVYYCVDSFFTARSYPA